MDPNRCGMDSTVGGKVLKANSSMRRQQEGMGNLWKNGLAPEHEDSPWGESHGTHEVRAAKEEK